jgi:hypothetical protein
MRIQNLFIYTRSDRNSLENSEFLYLLMKIGHLNITQNDFVMDKSRSKDRPSLRNYEAEVNRAITYIRQVIFKIRYFYLSREFKIANAPNRRTRHRSSRYYCRDNR